MKLFGSLNNRLMESSKQPVPAVGMGATMTSYSDRHAGTVVNVVPRMIVVQLDRAIRTDANGMSDCQSYRYEPDHLGEVWVFRQDRDGRWREAFFNDATQRWRFVEGGRGLVLDLRDKHHDFGF